MRFTQDSSSSTHLIRAYGSGELRVNDDVYRSTIIVSASAVQVTPDIRNMEDLARLDPARILAFEPELVLLGTGPRQLFPAATSISPASIALSITRRAI